jgi:enoyl-CoA hydratase
MSDTNTSLLAIEAGEGTQTWTMDSAPVNAIDPEFLVELETALAAAVADESVATIVLTSNLKVFSAGADAGWMSGVVAEKGAEGLLEDFNRTMDHFREVCIAIRRAPVLVIAALNGHTMAGGLELAAACDLRFCADAEKLRIGVPEMDLFGSMPSGGGGAQFIARLMGPSRALRFILDAKPIGPAAALEAGLVDDLFPAEELLERSRAFAAEVAAKAGRVGVAAAKRAILGGPELPLLEAMELDRSLHWDSMRRGNFIPGVADFVERYG